MHREILHVPKGVKVDHKNGNGLDNQRHNLRPATTLQNSQGFQIRRKSNNTGFRGVGHRRKGFRARITINKTEVYLGDFPTALQAANAYDAAARAHFGEFAHPNF